MDPIPILTAPFPSSWVSVTKMWPAETEVMVYPPSKQKEENKGKNQQQQKKKKKKKNMQKRPSKQTNKEFRQKNI